MCIISAGKKGEMDYDEVKKLLDDLKQQAKELGKVQKKIKM